MQRASIRNRLLLYYATVWLLCLPPPLWAVESDRDQPIIIEADSASLDDKRGHSTYRGNVHLQQGTLHMHGKTMTVQMHNYHIEKIVLIGNPATYVQQLDESGEKHHAEAGRMVYQAGKDLLILKENARVWQPGEEEFSSEQIIYNLVNKTINAGGDSDGDRVRITLQPHKSDTTTGSEDAPSTADVQPAPGGSSTTESTP